MNFVALGAFLAMVLVQVQGQYDYIDYDYPLARGKYSSEKLWHISHCYRKFFTD